MEPDPLDRWRRWADVVLTCYRGVMWALLLALVAYAYSYSGSRTALLLASLFSVAYQLGWSRKADKETAELNAKLDELRRRLKP